MIEDFSLVDKLEYYETKLLSAAHSTLVLLECLMNEKDRYKIRFNKTEKEKNRPEKLLFKFYDKVSYDSLVTGDLVHKLGNPYELKLDSSLSIFIKNELKLNAVQYISPNITKNREPTPKKQKKKQTKKNRGGNHQRNRLE